MRRLRIARSFLTVFLLFAGAGGGGCGYWLQGNPPHHLKTVSVPVFKNQTTEAGRKARSPRPSSTHSRPTAG
jgi:hypothetical protein